MPDDARARAGHVLEFLNNDKPGAPRNGSADSLYMTSGVHVDRVTVNGAPFDSGNDAWRGGERTRRAAGNQGGTAKGGTVPPRRRDAENSLEG